MLGPGRVTEIRTTLAIHAIDQLSAPYVPQRHAEVLLYGPHSSGLGRSVYVSARLEWAQANFAGDYEPVRWILSSCAGGTAEVTTWTSIGGPTGALVLAAEWLSEAQLWALTVTCGEGGLAVQGTPTDLNALLRFRNYGADGFSSFPRGWVQCDQVEVTNEFDQSEIYDWTDLAQLQVDWNPGSAPGSGLPDINTTEGFITRYAASRPPHAPEIDTRAILQRNGIPAQKGVCDMWTDATGAPWTAWYDSGTVYVSRLAGSTAESDIWDTKIEVGDASGVVGVGMTGQGDEMHVAATLSTGTVQEWRSVDGGSSWTGPYTVAS